MRASLPIGALCAAAIAGCSYSYKNPAEALRPGEAHGLVGVEAGSTFQGKEGIAVGLLHSGLAQSSRPSGAYSVLALPQGTHTVLYRNGTGQAVRREVTIDLGSDGQPEGVALAHVVMEQTASVSGTVTPPGSVSVLGAGLVVDESTGATAPLTQDPSSPFTDCPFFFPSLEPGDHLLKIVLTLSDGVSPTQLYVGGPFTFTVTQADQQGTKQLLPIPIRPAAGVGQLQLRVRVLGDATVSPGQVSVTLADASTFGASTPVPVTVGSDGTVFTSLPEGLYRVQVAAPATPAFVAPAPIMTVVLADDLDDLGSVFLVSQSLADQAQAECASDADCAPGTCQSGQCTGWTPPAVFTPALAVCDSQLTCSANAACSVRSGTPSGCVPSGALQICVPCQSCCFDGAAVVCGNADPTCPKTGF